MKAKAGTVQRNRWSGSARARADAAVQVGQYLASGANHERCVRRVVEEGGVCEEDEAESILVGGYARAVIWLRHSQQLGYSGPDAVAEAVQCGIEQELRAHAKSSSSA